MFSFDLDQTKKFLEALGNKMPGDNKFTFQTFGDGKDRRNIKELRRVFHGTLDELIDVFTGEIYNAEILKELNQKGAGIFVTINLTDGRGRSTENIIGLRAAFIDADNIDLLAIFSKDPDINKCYPNILVKSKRGYHAYWLLDRWEPDWQDKFTPLQIALIEKFHTDPEPKDLARVMRLPGFYHVKENPELVTLAHVNIYCNVSGHEKDGQNRDGNYRGYTINELVDLLNLEIKDLTPKWKKEDHHQIYSSSDYPHEFRLYLAGNYLFTLIPPVKGSGTAHETVGSACRVGHDFDCNKEDFWPILKRWGALCSPPFMEKDLRYEYDTFLKAAKYPPGTKLNDPNFNRKAQYHNWLRSQGFDVGVNVSVYRDESIPWHEVNDISSKFFENKFESIDGSNIAPFPEFIPPDANISLMQLDYLDEYIITNEINLIKRALEKTESDKKEKKKRRVELANKGIGYLVWKDIGDPPKLKKTKDGRYKVKPSYPRETAWYFLNKRCKTDDQLRTLHYQYDSFVEWDGVCYQRFKVDEYRPGVASFLAYCAEEKELDENEDPVWIPFKVNRTRKAEVLEALQDITSLNKELIHAPCWLINDDNLPDPREIICCQNGLLDVRNNKLFPCTPAFFTLNSVSIDYDPNAKKPSEFIKFLNSVFNDDEESKKLLKWWFGYCLTQDTRQHKMLMLVGKSRSGKGVITRILKELVGTRAYGSMDFHTMSSNFAMSSALDKSILVFPDARIGIKLDQAAVVAKLLSITGEDTVHIDRKNQSIINEQLKCRVMIVSNEILSLYDPSGAIKERLLLINFPEGKEEIDQDKNLDLKLKKELPGILNWAIEGWHELQQNGMFFQPQKSIHQLEVFATQSSPIGQFIDDICTIEKGIRVPIKSLFEIWKIWAEINNFKVGNSSRFGREIMAAFPSIERVRLREGESRTYAYEGINIDWQKAEDYIDNNSTMDMASVRQKVLPSRQLKIIK